MSRYIVVKKTSPQGTEFFVIKDTKTGRTSLEAYATEGEAQNALTILEGFPWEEFAIWIKTPEGKKVLNDLGINEEPLD